MSSELLDKLFPLPKPKEKIHIEHRIRVLKQHSSAVSPDGNQNSSDNSLALPENILKLVVETKQAWEVYISLPELGESFFTIIVYGIANEKLTRLMRLLDEDHSSRYSSIQQEAIISFQEALLQVENVFTQSMVESRQPLIELIINDSASLQTLIDNYHHSLIASQETGPLLRKITSRLLASIVEIVKALRTEELDVLTSQIPKNFEGKVFLETRLKPLFLSAFKLLCLESTLSASDTNQKSPIGYLEPNMSDVKDMVESVFLLFTSKDHREELLRSLEHDKYCEIIWSSPDKENIPEDHLPTYAGLFKKFTVRTLMTLQSINTLRSVFASVYDEFLLG